MAVFYEQTSQFKQGSYLLGSYLSMLADFEEKEKSYLLGHRLRFENYIFESGNGIHIRILIWIPFPLSNNFQAIICDLVANSFPFLLSQLTLKQNY